MTTDTREIGQRYEADSGVMLPPLDGLPEVAAVSDPEVETLTAEYYDTDDLRLLRAGVTLRRREGGADAGWHLKLPDKANHPGATTRRELGVPLDRSGDPVPWELGRLIRVHSRGAALRPVARIQTRRRRTTLLDRGGTSLAEVVADDVAAQTLGESTTLSRWSEIEVGLTGGSPELLRAAGKRLRGGGLRPAGHVGELERALAVEQPAVRPGHRRDCRSAGEVVLGYLGEQAARLESLDPAVRGDEPDAVHQMRVTTRRLRSTLASFTAVLPGAAARRLQDDLKWLGEVLGRARDCEVLGEQLRAELDRTPVELVLGPAKARVQAHFASREAAARGAVLEAMDSPRYFGLLDELDRLLGDPPLTPAAARSPEVLTAAVARDYRRTRRRMRRARRAPAGPGRDVALHQTRKAAKRARYAAEAVVPVFGDKARRFSRRVKAVQSILGDHQDAVNAGQAAREIGVHAHLAGENAFTFGLLCERAHRDALDYQDDAMRAWKRVKGKSRGWLS
jgi:CHAD domain-containing protein